MRTGGPTIGCECTVPFLPHDQGYALPQKPEYRLLPGMVRRQLRRRWYEWCQAMSLRRIFSMS